VVHNSFIYLVTFSLCLLISDCRLDFMLDNLTELDPSDPAGSLRRSAIRRERRGADGTSAAAVASRVARRPPGLAGLGDLGRATPLRPRGRARAAGVGL
jgi:hypothetical protein